MDRRAFGGALAVLVGTGMAAGAQEALAQEPQGMSNRNLLYVRRRLEAMIDQLQRDRHDYGGHRVAAINALQAARNEILAAIAWQQRH